MMSTVPKGWIKLHRDLEANEVFRDSDTLRIFLYVVCRAVTKKTSYRGVEIERGQLAITYQELANDLTINKWRVRKIVLKLCSAHYLQHITQHSRQHSLQHTFSVITVCDFDNYQGSSRSSAKTVGNTVDNTVRNSPPVSTLLYDKEIYIKKIEEEETSSSSSALEKILIEKIIDDEAWKSKVAATFKLDETKLVKRLDEFFISNECRGKYHADLADLKSHFINWLQIILNPKNNNSNENNETGRRDKRRGMDAGVHSAEEYEGPF